MQKPLNTFKHNSLLPRTLYSAEQVRELDRCATVKHGIPGYELMQRAAQSTFECMQAMLAQQKKHDKLSTLILVACGGGNNAGDGYVIARYALTSGYRVHVLSLLPMEQLSGDALTAAQDWQQCGGKNIAFNAVDCSRYHIIIDALLGTGLQREVGGDFQIIIEKMNASLTPILAVDIPSGLAANTGQPLGAAVRASNTISFIGLKQGMFTCSAADYCGVIHYSELGVPAEVLASAQPEAELIVKRDLQVALPQRKRNTHKGNFGHVLIVGGAPGMMGAAQMAAMAALRVGAGLVSVATSAEHAALLSVERPELMSYAIGGKKELMPLLQSATVIAIGPGLGVSSWAKSLLTAVLAADQPLIVDADGLNLLSKFNPSIFKSRRNWVLTPHPGEAGRLLGQSTQQIQADRFTAVRGLTERYQAISVLKGAGSLVYSVESPIISVCNRRDIPEWLRLEWAIY